VKDYRYTVVNDQTVLVRSENASHCRSDQLKPGLSEPGRAAVEGGPFCCRETIPMARELIAFQCPQCGCAPDRFVEAAAALPARRLPPRPVRARPVGRREK